MYIYQTEFLCLSITLTPKGMQALFKQITILDWCEYIGKSVPYILYTNMAKNTNQITTTYEHIKYFTRFKFYNTTYIRSYN